MIEERLKLLSNLWCVIIESYLSKQFDLSFYKMSWFQCKGSAKNVNEKEFPFTKFLYRTHKK